MKQRRWVDFTILAVCLSGAAVTMALDWQSPIATSLRRGERIQGLLIGSDYEDYTPHSDTLMYVSYDPQTRFLDVMSIPRDTMISDPSRPHVRRINEVFAYEWRHVGHNFTLASLALKSVVENLLSTGSVAPSTTTLLGMTPEGTPRRLSIPYFFTVDYGGFRALIDALGGVYVKVTEPMHYDDNWGHLHIHFDPGTYLLDGKHALEYVRFRGSSADQGRVLRQQLFVKELLKRLKNPSLLWRLPHYSKLVLSGFHTNIGFWDMASMLLEGRRMKWNNLRLFSLPGAPNGNLWKMNPEGTRRILALMEAPGPRGLPSNETPARSKDEAAASATVEVWNASNRPNAARAVMQLLREKGFDVVLFGNFSTRQQRTLVIDRSGRLRPAQAVAQVLKSVNPEVVSRVDSARQVDVSVIIGNDYQATDSKWPL